MKISAFKRNAENVIKKHEDWLASLEGMTDEEREAHLPGPVSAVALVDAKEALKLLEAYKRLSKDDKNRLHSFPAHATDWRPLADVRNRLGCSWNVLKALARLEPDSSEPQARYDAKNTVQIKMKLNKATDADILSRLEEVENKQGYIKGLIRKDISGQQ